MRVSFSDLPSTAKVWIYCADRPFTTEEKTALLEKLEPFLERWRSEGKEFYSAYEILRDQVLVVGGYGENFALSGCTMDALAKTVKKWADLLDTDMTSIPKFCYLKENHYQTNDRSGFKEAIKKGDVKEDTIVLDNTVLDINAYREGVEKQAKDSWHARLF